MCNDIRKILEESCNKVRISVGISVGILSFKWEHSVQYKYLRALSSFMTEVCLQYVLSKIAGVIEINTK